MSGPSIGQGDAQLSSFSFQPPAGGDVTLKSSDGTLFTVHSLLLILASKVFSDMLGSSTIPDVINLAEDAESISIMLAFVYPVTHPPINTLDLIEKAILVANRYNIDMLSKAVVQACHQQQNLVRQDPLRIYRLASKCGSDEIKAIVAKSITRAQYDLTSVEGLLQFSKEFPEASHVIGIVGAQGTRARILSEVLLKINTEVWSTGYQYMICDACKNKAPQGLGKRTGWWNRWAELLHSNLIETDLDECGSYFELSYIAQLRLEEPLYHDTQLDALCGRCCNLCIDQTCRHPSVFKEWADAVHQLLEEKLAKTDVLYKL